MPTWPVRPHVTCEACGHHQVLERTFSGEQVVLIRCHGCEELLSVHVVLPGQPSALQRLDGRPARP